MENLNDYLDDQFPGRAIRLSYTNQMLCARSGSDLRNVDACQGDSGGPIFRKVAVTLFIK